MCTENMSKVQPRNVEKPATILVLQKRNSGISAACSPGHFCFCDILEI
ncbi:hypothetical protein BVRB_7g160300 [Beta vulgaris subsp. vulgaris]|nr:hypothetical protein BVRB_7g160300 [Beta vulgaris subsp. vulgaris]